ncbi:MAG: hypothetical protein K8F91_09175, partial [Candidatus Obscuribacterales bacterium]|nr:hypothetical protein [Candidatus Obscuribacterales bacterium]
MSKILPITLSSIITLIIIFIAFTNQTKVAISLLGLNQSIALGAVLFLSYLLGILSAASLWSIRARKAKVAELTEGKWKKQDKKLAVEIKDDHVKQLEAK